MENQEIEILIVEDSMDDATLTLRSLKKNNIANHMHHVKDGAEFSPGAFMLPGLMPRNQD
jgi:two-component system, response regulator